MYLIRKSQNNHNKNAHTKHIFTQIYGVLGRAQGAAAGWSSFNTYNYNGEVLCSQQDIARCPLLNIW